MKIIDRENPNSKVYSINYWEFIKNSPKMHSGTTTLYKNRMSVIAPESQDDENFLSEMLRKVMQEKSIEIITGSCYDGIKLESDIEYREMFDSLKEEEENRLRTVDIQKLGYGSLAEAFDFIEIDFPYQSQLFSTNETISPMEYENCMRSMAAPILLKLLLASDYHGDLKYVEHLDGYNRVKSYKDGTLIKDDIEKWFK